MPALLQSISKARSLSSHRLQKFSTLFRSAMSTSHHSTVDEWPFATAISLHCSTAAMGCCSHEGGSRQARIKFAPHAANDFAASRPIPLLDPDIMTHFPLRSLPGTCLSVRNVVFVPRRAWNKSCKRYNPDKTDVAIAMTMGFNGISPF